MLTANELAPVTFEFGFRSFGLTQRTGRLVARLLTKYGELLSDEVGVTTGTTAGSIYGQFQMMFPHHGILTVTAGGATFEAWHPENSRPTDTWIPARLNWVAELFEEIVTIQKKAIDGVNFQTDWLFWEEKSHARLLSHLGIEGVMNGLFMRSTEFAVESEIDIPLPGLFVVNSTLRFGALGAYTHPENVGVQLKYWSPSASMDDLEISFTGDVVRRFLDTARAQMRQQLEEYFPTQGAK